jgi:hypothetical protein
MPHPSRIAAALLATLTACVVPVGPEWSDPPTNDPPTLRSAVPPVGQILVEPGLTVTVVLADQNTQDKLYLRWLIDYPPFQPDVSRLAHELTLPPEGKIARPAASFAPNCTDDHIAAGTTSHRLMLAVSDRPFVGDSQGEGALDQVPAGGYLIQAVWPFTLSCP